MILSCGSKHSWKVWQVSSYSLGAQHWVSLNDTWAYEPIFDSEFSSRGQADVLRNLTAACGSLVLSPDLVLKRTVRAPGQEETARFLEDHALDVVGFLLLLAMQGFAKHTSKDDMWSRAARYREVFEVVTKVVFGGTTMELGFDADADPNDLEVCCRPKASESGSIIVENGRVSLYSDDCQDFLHCSGA